MICILVWSSPSIPFSPLGDNNEVCVTYSFPVIDVNGNTVGVIGLDVSLVDISHSLSSTVIDGAYLFVMDCFWNVIASSSNSISIQNIRQDKLPDFVQASLKQFQRTFPTSENDPLTPEYLLDQFEKLSTPETATNVFYNYERESKFMLFLLLIYFLSNCL